MTAEDMNAVVNEINGELRCFGDRTKKDAYEDILAAFTNSVLALDGIIEVLVRRGADPNEAARLAMQYWAGDWSNRLAESLSGRWKLTEEELAELQRTVVTKLRESVAV